MLSSARAVTKLPAQDLERARRFYRNRLGLEPVEEREGGLRYVCGATEFHIFLSSGEPSGAATQLGFERGAFFRDSEGNLLGLGQATE